MTRLFEAKPFIVAEVGSNWTTLPECLASISAAKRVGADAVKFQLFDYQSLYGYRPNLVDSKTGELILNGDGKPATVNIDPTRGMLFPSWLPKLASHAKDEGLEFMCTAFSPELVAVVDPYVSVHKVASSDAAWPQMLEAVAKTGKPVLVSTGAKTGKDIDRAKEILGDNHIPVFCCAEYPADFADLTWVRAWTQNGLRVGFSDHTLGFTATVEAVKYGAQVIEKHFTAFPDLETPDRPHSLDPTQFARMVGLIRRLKPNYVAPLYEEGREQLMHLRANRRLIATSDITPGEVLRFSVNFGAFRSLVDDTRGASPFDWEKVNGRMAKGLILRGVAISLEDVE